MKLKLIRKGRQICPNCKHALQEDVNPLGLYCKECKAIYKEDNSDSISSERDELMRETEKDMKDLELRKNRG